MMTEVDHRRYFNMLYEGLENNPQSTELTQLLISNLYGMKESGLQQLFTEARGRLEKLLAIQLPDERPNDLDARITQGHIRPVLEYA